MATLKDLIKTETFKVGSNASMPSGSRVQIKQGAHEGAWGEITRYVSPSDGYVQVTSQGAGSTTGTFRLDGDVGKTTTVTPAGVTDFIPVRRGVTVYLFGANLKSYDMIFLKTIGGGYKRYPKALACNRFGGSLWLRLKTTSETLRKQVAVCPHRVGTELLLKRFRATLSQDRTDTPLRPVGSFACMRTELDYPLRRMSRENAQRFLLIQRVPGRGALYLSLIHI